MNSIFFIVVTLCSVTTSCCEFLYPVASYTDYDHQQKLLVAYQKTGTTLEIWSWDPATHIAMKMLPASFCPAGVSLLPNDKGFSFIDNGRIRIKEFIKRSARSVDMLYGLSNIGPITWNTNGLGYFHALEHRRYSLFSITPYGDVDRCLPNAKVDCMYPVCIEGSLFYIERAYAQQSSCRYRIIEQQLTDTISEKEPEPQALCADFDNRPIIFLTMISADEGFFVEHPSKIESNAPTITFLYHQLVRHGKNGWHTNHILSFSIPSELLDNTSDMHLYESIIPLLPRVYGSVVYYVDACALSLSLCSYNLVTNTKEPVVSPYNSDCPFVPIRSNSLLFFGGRIPKSTRQANVNTPSVYTDSDNSFCFSLPCLPCKDSQ